MILITKEFSCKSNYDFRKIGPLESLLFFDIETTGLSAMTSSLYLIGCVYYKEERWHYTQWFSECMADEVEILKQFFSFSKTFTHLIHFNGDGFDIPYVRNCCKQYNLDYNFNHLVSFDIYKRIKALKKLLALENIKQKTLERFLNTGRIDPFTGKELIELYKEYQKTKEKRLLDILLKHNEEDIIGLPNLLTLLSYEIKADEIEDIHSNFLPNGTVALTIERKCQVPVPIKRQWDNFNLAFHEKVFTLHIPLYEGELKFFYPNYKDYFYLPEEDMAIHKRVAEFVDKSHKKKATAATCYTKRQGLFLPQPHPIFEPVFYESYKTGAYFEYTDEAFKEKEKAVAYIQTLIHSIGS